MLEDCNLLGDLFVDKFTHHVLLRQDDHIMACLQVQESFDETDLHDSFGRVKETERFGPLLVHGISVLVFDPGNYQRCHVEEKFKVDARHFSNVLLKCGREDDLVFFQSARNPFLVKSLDCLLFEL